MIGGGAVDRQSTATQERGYFVKADDVKLVGVRAAGNAGVDVEIDAVADVQLIGCDVGSITDGGTRTRWNGVIGGGPLGGKDLGSLTGASAGDRPLADGTTAPRAYTV